MIGERRKKEKKPKRSKSTKNIQVCGGGGSMRMLGLLCLAMAWPGLLHCRLFSQSPHLTFEGQKSHSSSEKFLISMRIKGGKILQQQGCPETLVRLQHVELVAGVALNRVELHVLH